MFASQLSITTVELTSNRTHARRRVRCKTILNKTNRTRSSLSCISPLNWLFSILIYYRLVDC